MRTSGRRMAAAERRRYHNLGVKTARRMPMFDQILGLVLAILALIYLAYAMLRPERF
jgi:K+-transporting ATPase KdpF subunit